MRRVYIAGPMRNLPERNFPAFRSAALQLMEKGHEVVSPVDVGQQLERLLDKPTQQDYLIEDIKWLMTCNAIHLLEGWEGSCGASCEAAIAKTLNFAFVDAEGNPVLAPDAVVCCQSYPQREGGEATARTT